MSFRLTALAAVGLVVSLGACDTTYVDERGDVIVVDFTIDGDRYTETDDGYGVSFSIDDVDSAEDRDGLRIALREAGDGALVAAYIDTEAVLLVEGTGQTFSALPLTRAYEGVPIQVDEDGDGTPEVIPYVDSAVSYEYSFDNEDFYFDVVASHQLDWADYFGSFLPRNLNMRVVTVPADVFYARAGARIDLRDYEAVKAAYNLPD
ncbi:MAG: hypothetical protein AAF845_19975 [Bacteroidota bacterium]